MKGIQFFEKINSKRKYKGYIRNKIKMIWKLIFRVLFNVKRGFTNAKKRGNHNKKEKQFKVMEGMVNQNKKP